MLEKKKKKKLAIHDLPRIPGCVRFALRSWPQPPIVTESSVILLNLAIYHLSYWIIHPQRGERSLIGVVVHFLS